MTNVAILTGAALLSVAGALANAQSDSDVPTASEKIIAGALGKTSVREGRKPSVRVDRAYKAADAAYKAYELRDYGTAVARAREATSLAPTRRDYWVLVVNSLLAAGQLAQADEALDAAVQATGSHEAFESQRDVVRRSRALAAGTAMYGALQAGDLPGAALSARAAVRFAPNHPGYRLTLMRLLLLQEKYAEAEAFADESLALLPRSAALRMLRAHAHQGMGRWEQAVSEQDLALQLATPADAEREMRLIAADSALAAHQHERAVQLLERYSPDDQAVEGRRTAARQLTRGSSQSVAAGPGVPAGLSVPSVDCSKVETTLTCELMAGPAPRAPAFDWADAAYKALDANDLARAVPAARLAAVLAPDNREYQLLLLSAEAAAGNLREAEQAASKAVLLQSGDGAVLARRGQIRKELGNASGAREDFEAALKLGNLGPATEVSLLAEVGRNSEARQRLAQARAAGGLEDVPAVDEAYLAVRLRDQEAARLAFARADESGKLPVTALQDAAHASLRSGRDQEAAQYFKRAIDAANGPAPSLKLERQMLFDTRRAVADVSRTWGVLASLAYRNGGGVVPGFGVTPGSVGTKTLQAGAEVYWRPFGYRNGRYVELFARGFNTLYSEAGGATGGDSLQAAAGIRWKPLTDYNAVLSLSRVFTRHAPDDLLAQLAYSHDVGTDLRVDVPSWWTTRISAEVGRYLQHPQTYGLASVQAGRSYRFPGAGGQTVVFPHAVAAAEYNSTYEDSISVGAGPGVGLRYWFRGDAYAAPRSYVDFSMQYRARISGDKRASGLFLTTVLSY